MPRSPAELFEPACELASRTPAPGRLVFGGISQRDDADHPKRFLDSRQRKQIRISHDSTGSEVRPKSERLSRSHQVGNSHHGGGIIIFPGYLVGAHRGHDHDVHRSLPRFPQHLVGRGVCVGSVRVGKSLPSVPSPDLGQPVTSGTGKNHKAPGFGELVIGSPNGAVEELLDNGWRH